mmetsp:Transcript_31627/g.80731  ORF Transcript_31627/g.80731 Transcript_31627/m.80731 type:complete len:185 (-) Transcript_31627:109-663(-)
MAATLDSEAYITLFMHACKFPSRTVNGLLLGSVSGGGVSVQKTLPLFHTPLGLAPMLEAALMLADQYCKAHAMQVVGYYQANELCDDMELGPFGKTIAEKIRAQCKHATVLLVDGASMRPTEDNLRLVQVLSSASVPAPTLSEPAATLETLELALGRGVQHKLVDFDEHLDDASKDWFNTSLLS